MKTFLIIFALLFAYISSPLTMLAQPKNNALQDDSTLAKQLLEVQQNSLKSMSPERAAKYEQSLRDIAATGVLQKALKVGSKAPLFDLPNVRGTRITLQSQLAKGPVVVTFYRGAWCPFCNLQLRALQQNIKEFEKLGASVVAISPQLPDSSMKMQERNALQFEVLSDVRNNVAREYGILFSTSDKQESWLERYNGSTGGAKELPLAATYIIASNGTVSFAFVESDYRKRAEPAVLLRHLKTMRSR